jgi:hypothetical protein
MPTDPEVVCTLAEEPAMSILKNGSQIANTIFLGDLNVHKVYKQGSEYQALKNVMDRACPEALDIVEMSSFQATIWASTLIKAISGNESHGPDDRVDYIYFVPAKTGTSLHPAKVEVIPWWTISGDPRVRELDVSDHRPVLATFTY